MALSELEQFALMVAAISHDLDHPGKLADCLLEGTKLACGVPTHLLLTAMSAPS